MLNFKVAFVCAENGCGAALADGEKREACIKDKEDEQMGANPREDAGGARSVDQILGFSVDLPPRPPPVHTDENAGLNVKVCPHLSGTRVKYLLISF